MCNTFTKLFPQQIILEHHQHPKKETLPIHSLYAPPSSTPDNPHRQLMATTNLLSVSVDLNIVVDKIMKHVEFL